MADKTVKRIDAEHSPRGDMGQRYLASGVAVSMRLWEEASPVQEKPSRSRDYETVGYVLEGKAELEIEGEKILLEPGHSWVVPRGASHTYRILEPFKALEATSPPAHAHGRDEPVSAS